MRYGIWGIAALIVGAFAAHFLLQDNGYVLINFRGYVVEMSVPGLVLALIVLYVIVRVLVRIWRMPRDLGAAVAEHRVKRAHRKLTRGFIQLSEGDWRAGERQLTRGLKGSDTPLVNYLMAARAAQLQGSSERRNEWLKLAYEELPEAETAVLLTQAELQFEAGEHERALATLETDSGGEREPSGRLGAAGADLPCARRSATPRRTAAAARARQTQTGTARTHCRGRLRAGSSTATA